MPKKVLVELKVSQQELAQGTLSLDSETGDLPIDVDYDYAPQPVPPPTDAEAAAAVALEPDQELVIMRGEVADDVSFDDIRAHDSVAEVWTDAEVVPFTMTDADEHTNLLDLSPAMAPCPCPASGCDCNAGPTGAHGTDADVARYLGANSLWSQGIRGDGIVVGVVDTGVRANSFPGKVIGGWSPAGGSAPGANDAHYHGSMCANAVLAVAPNAKIFDLGLLKSSGSMSGFLSDAIAAYNWALARHAVDGTPHILTNSWGMYQKAWAADYATNPNHPFTRKVVEVINRGILVTFAAGNCGEVCPSGRCGSDNGPGKSIWGANGHPLVMTVGAANIDEEWIGYTSQGPAALAPDKPNFCAPSHFRGYTSNDNGTSAACPVAAGVLALLKSAHPSLTQGRAKLQLQRSAKDLCSGGWDANSGWGMINAAAAHRYLSQSTDYPICGVQFRRTIPANATRRYYTFNWPAIWHVGWTVVPTTVDRGAPQISWSVEVERASGDHLTYWITVENLTDTEVGIEGRYCIMGSE